MRQNQVLLGIDEYRCLQYASIDDNGIIQGFNGYDLIGPDGSADGNSYLSQCSWCHDCKFEYQGKLIEFKSGDKLKSLQDLFLNMSDEDKKLVDSAYETNGCYCSKCGTFHDTEDGYHTSYTIIDGELYCKTCVDAEELLTQLETADDLFKARDLVGVTIDDAKFEEIDVLFCDSSGFGRDGEPALTKRGAIAKTRALMSEYKAGELYCGLTSIGQFQVYVTIFRKVKSKKRKANKR